MHFRIGQAAGRLFALSFRVLSRRHRFTAAIVAARALQPVIRRSRAYGERVRLLTDSIRETSLDIVLLMLTRYGTRFDPRLTMVGAELLPSRESARATLLVSPHTMLSTLVLRHLVDEGVTPVVIAADRAMKIPGTPIGARVLTPTRTLLLTVRDLFAAGAVVCVMIDREMVERRTLTLRTNRGDLLISTALLQLALHRDVRILFMATGLDDRWHVKMNFVEVPKNRSATVADVVSEFGAFIDTHIEVPRKCG